MGTKVLAEDKPETLKLSVDDITESVIEGIVKPIRTEMEMTDFVSQGEIAVLEIEQPKKESKIYDQEDTDEEIPESILDEPEESIPIKPSKKIKKVRKQPLKVE